MPDTDCLLNYREQVVCRTRRSSKDGADGRVWTHRRAQHVTGETQETGDVGTRFAEL